MERPALIAPSILAADFARLGEEVAAIDEAGADWIHIDVMDGHFVPNLTFGAGLVKAIRPYSRKCFDVHLMVSPVDCHLEAFAQAGADILTVHAEAGPHLDRTLMKIRSLGKKVGLALNPATPASALACVLDRIDLVLVMTVNPGFGGQSFIAPMLDKVGEIKQMIRGRSIDIEVDGGINLETAPLAWRAGANVLVAGESIFRGGAYAANIRALRSAALNRMV